MENSTQDLERIAGLTAEITTAFVSHNSIAAGEVPQLITGIFGALVSLGAPQVAEAAPPEPAVPIRSSVKPDYVVCLEDGKKMKMLKRHLMTAYGMTPEDYRERWGLPADYPMVAPNYAAKRRELAVKIGLGRAPGQKRGRRKKAA